MNGYKIRGLLGEGSMAYVWRAFDPNLEREVALKEPKLAYIESIEKREAFNERFLREGRIAAKLNHPGIVTIHQVFLFDNRPWLVMELIDGVTLDQLLRRGDKLSVFQVWSLMERLLQAVAFAHEQGVIHQDLKPTNIFLTKDGSVKLSDFGIARMATQATLTNAGELVGTPSYMSPEQIRGEGLDARTDVFSLGVIGYELLLGKNPFVDSSGTHFFTIMHRILTDAPPELASEGFDLSALQQLLRRAVAKDREVRPANAGDFLKAWREIEVAPATSDAAEELGSLCKNIGAVYGHDHRQPEDAASLDAGDAQSPQISTMDTLRSTSGHRPESNLRRRIRVVLLILAIVLTVAGVTLLGHRVVLGIQNQMNTELQQTIEGQKQNILELEEENHRLEIFLNEAQQEIERLNRKIDAQGR